MKIPTAAPKTAAWIIGILMALYFLLLGTSSFSPLSPVGPSMPIF